MITEEKLEKLKKLADAMYYAAQYLTTDASRLHKAMDEYHKFVTHEYIAEELVSEDLEEASLRASIIRGQYIPKEDLDEYPYDAYAQSMFKRGANWQKEQMLANAVDGVVTFDYYDSGNKTYGCVAHDSFCLEDFGLKDRDKVKVIVIKEC